MIHPVTDPDPFAIDDDATFELEDDRDNEDSDSPEPDPVPRDNPHDGAPEDGDPEDGAPEAGETLTAETRTTDPDAATPPGALLDIPLEQIMADALTRDRAELDEAALWELQKSIAANGLRMPIEVFELAEPEPPLRYGLLSGYRRLRAFHALNEARTRYPTIPAFLRTPQSMAECLAAMVEENEIRAEISPWERGRIACQAVRENVFPNVEEAVAKLFPAASKGKRWRIRCLAQVVEELDGWLTAPEKLSLRQMMRISGACQTGLGDVIRAALEESSHCGPGDQWRLIEPILFEAESQPADAPVANTRGLFRRPDRPRRLSKPRGDLVIRRERTRDGYALHFTGKLATSDLLDTVFDEIDRLFAPA